MALQTSTADDRRMVRKTLTVLRPAEELFDFWSDLSQLPRFMEQVESVQVMDGRSHWIVKGPGGKTVEWDAAMDAEAPTALAWHTLPNSEIQHDGEVRFLPAPEGRGTEVTVTLKYTPPAGKAGVAVAKLFGEDPGSQLDTDLHRFKQLMETGSIPTVAGQTHGTRANHDDEKDG